MAHQPPSNRPSDKSDLLAHVDPELYEFAQQLLQITPPEGVGIDIETLSAGRGLMPLKPLLDKPLITEAVISGVGGAPDIPVFIVNASPPRSLPAILHLHGGGFVLGDARGDLANLQLQASELDCVIIAPNYRLAPETTFPGPLDDAYAALRWLRSNCEKLGADPSRIAIQGESAGGGLAAMLAITARDRGEVPLVHQSLIYPMLDDRTGSSKLPFPIGRLGWTGELNRAAWRALLGRQSDHPPLGSVPSRIDNLSGLPDTFIAVGGIDLFVLEDIAYANRLIEQSVPTNLLVIPGAFHGFDVMAPQSKIARDWKRAQFNALRRAFKTRTGN